MNCIQCRVPYGSNEGQVCPRCQAEQDQAEHRLQELGEEYLNHEAELTTIPEGVPMNLTKDKPVLPRRIAPEDVRVGMVVERRKDDAAMRDRVHLIDNALIGLTGFCLWMPEYAAVGWSLWLVEDAPAPVDPDAEALDQMAQAMANLDGSDDADEWVPWAEVALDALRETHDVTPRADQ